MKITWLLAFILALTVFKLNAGNIEELDVVERDPFQKPEYMKAPEKSKKAINTIKTFWKPNLIMTLRAGKNSMANVGGEIVSLGEKIDGYKLIEVNERAAVFVNQGKITRLTLDE